MDFFGIGASIKGAVEIYFRSARATGRTTHLVKSLRDGDRVICLDWNQARAIKRLCEEQGKRDVETFVYKGDDPRRVFDKPTAKGRVIFDHVWLEQFYLRNIQEMTNLIDSVEKQASRDYKPTTKFAAKTARRWEF